VYLFIDTSGERTIVQALDENLKVVRNASKDGQKNQSENLLKLIDKVLRQSKKSAPEVRGIFVMRGPGSYTGLRVGVATANTLAYMWGINTLGIEKNLEIEDVGKLQRSNKPVLPKYSYPPKITKEKSRL